MFLVVAKRMLINTGKRVIALLLTCSMLFPSLGWAFDASTFPLAQNTVSLQNRSIEIPGSYARVFKTFRGKSRLVIHIQDLHCNYEVQKNIQELVGKLAHKQGVRLIGVEGAYRTINTSKLRTFPIKDIREEVAEYFLRQGKLSGAEVYACTGEQPVRLVGIEDKELYAQNQKTVRSLLTDEGLGLVCDLREHIETIKKDVYHAPIKKFDQKYQQFRTGKNSLQAFGKYLIKMAQSLDIPVGGYSQLQKYVSSAESIFAVNLDSDRLFREQEKLAQTIRNLLYIQKEEAELDLQIHRLDIVERMLNISAAQQDLWEYRDNPYAFRAQSFLEYILSKGPEIRKNLGSEIFHLDKQLKMAEDFYNVADERSLAFVTNLRARMKEQDEHTAILITGGYHTEHVLAALEKENISYLSIKPRITHQDVVNPYFSLLQNRRTPLEKMLAQNQTMFTLAPNLPQCDSSNIPDEAIDLSAQERVFSQCVELYLKIRTVFYFYLQKKIGQALEHAINQTLSKYAASTDAVQVEASKVQVHAGNILTCPGSINQTQGFLSVFWQQGQKAPLELNEVLEISALKQAGLAIVGQEQIAPVLAKLGNQNRLSARWQAIALRRLMGLYIFIFWASRVAAWQKAWLAKAVLNLEKLKPIVRISPDLALRKISHNERNLLLADMIKQARLFRLNAGGRIRLQFYRHSGVWKNVSFYFQTARRWISALWQSRQVRRRVYPRLQRIRRQNGALDRVCQTLPVSHLAQQLGRSEEVVRKELLAIAKNTDVLLVRDIFLLHPEGPIAHARCGVARPGDQGIWLGEKLFTAKGIKDAHIAHLLLEEAQHILAPQLDHDVIRHSEELFKHLKKTAYQLDEIPGDTVCMRDASTTLRPKKEKPGQEILAKLVDPKEAKDFIKQHRKRMGEPLLSGEKQYIGRVVGAGIVSLRRHAYIPLSGELGAEAYLTNLKIVNDHIIEVVLLLEGMGPDRPCILQLDTNEERQDVLRKRGFLKFHGRLAMFYFTEMICRAKNVDWPRYMNRLPNLRFARFGPIKNSGYRTRIKGINREVRLSGDKGVDWDEAMVLDQGCDERGAFLQVRLTTDTREKIRTLRFSEWNERGEIHWFQADEEETNFLYGVRIGRRTAHQIFSPNAGLLQVIEVCRRAQNKNKFRPIVRALAAQADQYASMTAAERAEPNSEEKRLIKQPVRLTYNAMAELIYSVDDTGQPQRLLAVDEPAGAQMLLDLLQPAKTEQLLREYPDYFWRAADYQNEGYVGQTSENGRIPLEESVNISPGVGLEPFWHAYLLEVAAVNDHVLEVVLRNEKRVSLENIFQIDTLLRSADGRHLVLNERLGVIYLRDMLNQPQAVNWQEYLGGLPDLRGLSLGTLNSNSLKGLAEDGEYRLFLLNEAERGWDTRIVGCHYDQEERAPYLTLRYQKGGRVKFRVFKIAGRLVKENIFKLELVSERQFYCGIYISEPAARRLFSADFNLNAKVARYRKALTKEPGAEIKLRRRVSQLIRAVAEQAKRWEAQPASEKGVYLMASRILADTQERRKARLKKMSPDSFIMEKKQAVQNLNCWL